jgi:hypothetical protein
VVRDLGFSPWQGASGPKCLSGENSEPEKAQGLKPGFLLGLYGPTEVVP